MEIGIQAASIGRAFLFLGIPFVLMVFYFQWRWARTCDRNIQVLLAQQSGGGRYFLAPKEGGSVSITNPHTNTIRAWAINELATIDITYPGVGFVPKFLQKTIRLAILNEGDWEPLLNRSPHMKNVASPDLVLAFQAIAERANEATEKEITNLLANVATSPTREMIASPAVLGNLMFERISELAVTVAKDIVNPLQEAIKKLGQRINPTIVYILLGLNLVLVAFIIIKVLPVISGLEKLSIDISLIKQALGVTGVQ